MTQVVGIFTGKDIPIMESEGGSGYWVVRSDRVKSSEYVIFMRNRRAPWAAKDGLGHGQAFAIGKITGCISSKVYDGRKIIQMSEYAPLPDTDNFKKAWKNLTHGQRYPVAYLSLNDLQEVLDLNIHELDWIKFNANPNAESHLEESDLEDVLIDDDKELSEIVLEAKEMIALMAGVDTDNVKIQISF